ncbi:50S ribosomal protein L24 [Candidatus Pacearchaeota archaeon CG_4_9_14_3_um_filter_31_7]|nr:MAG: 50S ribosomal protein L24 [Candidatus Pacearchaeota archaeon CG1_02_31_27]PIN92370.1 MAG: 50S ribosomal protein L24 [Candidatus Pacearchaeota archaeon CG10_big_fil_rev_8_21_14_0_10_31_59]PIZ80672.1 MAG: 50S ribosomal protein L24 [Candidatus Pacearchaeota archaeon CG_4_10_14_0_2_um_filter_31_10]PJA70803.1 MAG: 50S ribosomal protein L24 [Candidatus Pacearchaeota archaeon CG_4_9_14_3_um_filter_31_7]
MKKKFSDKWIKSKQPRKQRKYRENAPLHLKQKMLKSTLSKDLRKKYGIRNIILRKGDTVKIMRGNFRKKEGKILEVNLKKMKVMIENIQINKKDGTKVNVWIDPSNLKITQINLDDKRRKEKIEKKISGEKKK